MSEDGFPFETDPGDPGDLPGEDSWRAMARLWARTGVVDIPGGTVLKVFADSSGMHVFLPAGKAWIDGVYYTNASQKTITIPNNATGVARVDLVVAEVDPTTNTIVGLKVTSLTNTPLGVWDLLLARVTVDPGAVTIAAAKVADARTFTNRDIIPCRTVADILDAKFGDIARESVTGAFLTYNGTTWVPPDKAQIANTLFIETIGLAGHFDWVDPGGTPAYLWGSNDGATHRVYPPSRLSVAFAASASSAGFASTAGSAGTCSVAASAQAVNGATAQGTVLLDGNGLHLGKFAGGGNTGASINNTGDLGRASSSRRVKRDIEPLVVDLELLRRIQVFSFRYDPDCGEDIPDDGESTYAGFMAEDVADVFPLGAALDDSGRPVDIDERALLAAAYLRIQDLETRLLAVESRLNNLEV